MKQNATPATAAGQYGRSEIFLTWAFFCLVLPVLTSQPAVASPAPLSEVTSATIRVRIAENLGRGRIRGFDLQANHLSANGSAEWTFRCDGARIHLTRGLEKLKLPSPVLFESPAGMLQLEDRPYRDRIRVYSKKTFCVVINEVDLEKYLEGLVNAEFNSRWSEEAIAAQVVAARTYAVHRMREARDRGSYFDVDSTIKDQVYDGFSREDFRAARVVAKTKGMILALRKPSALGKPIPLKAFYHSTCGGNTELPERVWGGSFPGFSKKVDCPYCASSPAFRWNVELNAEDIRAAILEGVQNTGVPKNWPSSWPDIVSRWNLKEIRMNYWDPQLKDRASNVILVWEPGATSLPVASSITGRHQELRVSAARFRGWVGVGRMKSTGFTVSSAYLNNGPYWSFTGRGNGHGVGLCQWGAKVMGEKGHKMAGILRHYYPDAVLRKL